MFTFGRNQIINHEMSKYIKEQTNKSMEKYLRTRKNELITVEELLSKNYYYDTRVSDLDIRKKEHPIFLLVLPFIVCPFFIACYYFHKV
jgi:hypothetical protein